MTEKEWASYDEQAQEVINRRVRSVREPIWPSAIGSVAICAVVIFGGTAVIYLTGDDPNYGNYLDTASFVLAPIVLFGAAMCGIDAYIIRRAKRQIEIDEKVREDRRGQIKSQIAKIDQQVEKLSSQNASLLEKRKRLEDLLPASQKA